MTELLKHTSAEKERYNNVVAKMRAAGLAKADEFLAGADELLKSNLPSSHKQAKDNILLAISLKNGDVPAKYYWAWLRTFLGAANDEMMTEVAYPVKDDIFYKRAMERANSQEAARYERIAERCHKLYNCRIQTRKHHMTLNSSLTRYSFDRVPGEREEFISNMGGEVIQSFTREVENYEKALDKYMVKYIAGIIPDPYISVEGADDCSRYKSIVKETVSVYLHDVGRYGRYNIRDGIKEYLGLSEDEATDIVSNAPCYVAHDLPMEKAIAFCRTCLGKFGNSGAIVRIHAKPLDDIIREYAEPSVSSNERVSVYMTKSKSNVKDTIRYLRDKFGIDKRTAKEMAENTSRAISYNREPACIAANIPLSQAKELTDVLFDEYSAEGEIRWQ